MPCSGCPAILISPHTWHSVATSPSVSPALAGPSAPVRPSVSPRPLCPFCPWLLPGARPPTWPRAGVIPVPASCGDSGSSTFSGNSRDVTRVTYLSGGQCPPPLLKAPGCIPGLWITLGLVQSPACNYSPDGRPPVTQACPFLLPNKAKPPLLHQPLYQIRRRVAGIRTQASRAPSPLTLYAGLSRPQACSPPLSNDSACKSQPLSPLFLLWICPLPRLEHGKHDLSFQEWTLYAQVLPWPSGLLQDKPREATATAGPAAGSGSHGLWPRRAPLLGAPIRGLSGPLSSRS